MTDKQLQAQVTALQNDVRKMGALLREVARKLDIAVDAAPRHVEKDGRVFVPGTGWTGSEAPEPEGDTVSREEGLAKVRELRSAKRSS